MASLHGSSHPACMLPFLPAHHLLVACITSSALFSFSLARALAPLALNLWKQTTTAASGWFLTRKAGYLWGNILRYRHNLLYKPQTFGENWGVQAQWMTSHHISKQIAPVPSVVQTSNPVQITQVKSTPRTLHFEENCGKKPQNGKKSQKHKLADPHYLNESEG